MAGPVEYPHEYDLRPQIIYMRLKRDKQLTSQPLNLLRNSHDNFSTSQNHSPEKLSDCNYQNHPECLGIVNNQIESETDEEVDGPGIESNENESETDERVKASLRSADFIYHIESSDYEIFKMLYFVLCIMKNI